MYERGGIYNPNNYLKKFGKYNPIKYLKTSDQIFVDTVGVNFELKYRY